MALCNFGTKDKDDSLYLIDVGQINLRGPKAISDVEQRLKVAKLNLSTGKMTMVSEFISVYYFFDNGMSCLKNGHWESKYELSLALYNVAAECAIQLRKAC